MAKVKKTWIDKLNAPVEAEVKPCPVDIAGMKKGQIMLLPTPKLIDAFIRKIPRGRGMDVKAMRAKLAAQHHAEITCPIVTGFHVRTVAEAVYEAFNAGTSIEKITPFWRVLDANSPTTKKLSFDSAFLMQQREREGLS